MKRIQIAADRWNFQLAGSGEFIVPLGGNLLNDQHPATGTLFDRFDAADCDRRLGWMADLGLNCLRQAIGVNRVFHPKTGLKPRGLKNWDRFIGLCEKHGIYLMPVGGYIGGNDWVDIERLADSGRALDESCAFWEKFVGHYAGHPAIWAWDLRNELLYTNRPHSTPSTGAAAQRRLEARLLDGWPRWLTARYGTVAAMNRAWGTRYPSFRAAPGRSEFVEKPGDQWAYDARCYLNDRGYHWCKRQCEVIRRVSPGHLIVSGNNSWLYPGLDLWMANGFPNHALHELFDFTTHHPYPAWECLPTGHGDPLDGGRARQWWLSACIGMSRANYHDRPVVLQEFGWYGGGRSRFLTALPYRSQREHAAYTEALVEALLPHVNGFLNWPTFDMPAARDISNHGGIFTAAGQRKKLAAVYARLAGRLRGQRLQRAAGTKIIRCSLRSLYTCRAAQDRLFAEVHSLIREGGIPDFVFLQD